MTTGHADITGTFQRDSKFFVRGYSRSAISPTPSCTTWQAIDLAGHLRCVAENYLEYLQDAPDSRPAKLFAQEAASAVLIRQQARQNATEQAVLPPE